MSRNCRILEAWVFGRVITRHLFIVVKRASVQYQLVHSGVECVEKRGFLDNNVQTISK